MPPNQELFDHMQENHGLTLTQSEMEDIKKFASKITKHNISSLLNKWRVEHSKLEDTLQVGRCGSDDLSMGHGRMDALEDHIEDLECCVL